MRPGVLWAESPVSKSAGRAVYSQWSEGLRDRGKVKFLLPEFGVGGRGRRGRYFDRRPRGLTRIGGASAPLASGP